MRGAKAVHSPPIRPSCLGAQAFLTSTIAAQSKGPCPWGGQVPHCPGYGGAGGRERAPRLSDTHFRRTPLWKSEGGVSVGGPFSFCSGCKGGSWRPGHRLLHRHCSSGPAPLLLSKRVHVGWI